MLNDELEELTLQVKSYDSVFKSSSRVAQCFKSTYIPSLKVVLWFAFLCLIWQKCIWTQSNIYDGAFCNNSQYLPFLKYFGKKFHRRCLTRFWMCLCIIIFFFMVYWTQNKPLGEMLLHITEECMFENVTIGPYLFSFQHNKILIRTVKRVEFSKSITSNEYLQGCIFAKLVRTVRNRYWKVLWETYVPKTSQNLNR